MAILCGSDLSPASASALDVGLALAKQRGDAGVLLVHVAPENMKDSALDKTRRELDAQGKAAAERSGLAVRTELLVGEPEEALPRFAETEACDLIVIAARSTRMSTMKLSDADPPP